MTTRIKRLMQFGPQTPSVIAEIAAMSAMLGMGFARGHEIGPGRRTLYTLHNAVGRSRYTPHQGERECARRLRHKKEGGPTWFA